MSGGGSDLVIGFKYLFGIHMGIGRGPVDELIEIKVGDKSAWRGSIVANGQTVINAPNLFGGEKGEGGIDGTLTALFGGPAQIAPAEMETTLIPPMPGFRGMFTVFFDGVVSMMNPYPKPWKFRVRRALQGWDGGAAWYPETAVISLVRPLSAGEAQGSSTQRNITTSETLTIGLAAGTYMHTEALVISAVPADPLVVTISPPDTLASIDSVYSTFTTESESGTTVSNFYFVEAVNYTAVGNVITFIDGGVPFDYHGLTVNVAYTYTVVTSNPLAVTISPGGAIVSIDSIYSTFASETEAGVLYQNFYFVAGTNYTVAGNVITFNPAGVPFTYPGLTVHVAYTYTLVTVDPLGGIGDVLIQAMNPVHMIYETLTNRQWGRGLDPTRLDDTAWRFAAAQAFSERFGLCLRWIRRDEIKSLVQSILDHVGGALYDDRKTGKIKIKLIRNDYVKADLPFFDKDSGLLEIRDAAVATLGGMINEIRINYTDPVTDEERTVRDSNLAALQAANGTINSISKSYPGIPTSELASRIARRDLKAMSPSVRRFTITLDRRGYNVTPAGLIRIQDMDRGIPDMVLRVGTVDYGKLAEGKIVVHALQDVFGLPQRGFTTIGPPQWRPLVNRACIGETLSFEMPYRSMYRALNTADLAFVPSTAAYLGVVTQEGRPLNAVFNIAVRPGAVEPEDQPANTDYMCA